MKVRSALQAEHKRGGEEGRSHVGALRQQATGIKHPMVPLYNQPLADDSLFCCLASSTQGLRLSVYVLYRTNVVLAWTCVLASLVLTLLFVQSSRWATTTGDMRSPRIEG